MKKSNVKRFEKGGYNVGTYNTRPTPEQQNKERSRRERERNIALDKADAIEEVGSPLDLIAPGANLGRRVAGKLVDKALSKATPKSFKEGMDALYHARRPGRMVPKSKTQLQELMGQRTPRDRLSTDEAAKSHGVDGDATYWGDQFKKGGKVKKMADGGMTGFRAATPKPQALSLKPKPPPVPAGYEPNSMGGYSPIGYKPVQPPRPPIPVAPTITPKPDMGVLPGYNGMPPTTSAPVTTPRPRPPVVAPRPPVVAPTTYKWVNGKAVPVGDAARVKTAPLTDDVMFAPKNPQMSNYSGPQSPVGMKRGGKVGKVMGEFKSGALKSSSGQKVTNRKQAMAIAMSEAGKSKMKKFAAGGKTDKRSFASGDVFSNYDVGKDPFLNSRKGGTFTDKEMKDGLTKEEIMRKTTPKEMPKPKKYARGGKVGESKEMVKKEMVFMRKKGAPKFMMKHEKEEAKGMKKMAKGGMSCMKHGGDVEVKGYKKGGMIDGCAQRGKTKGKVC